MSTINGTPNGESLEGTADNDTVNGFGGNNGGGNDEINGTAGDDSLDGTAGDDTINGFAGNDELIGFAGNDLLNGDEGGDLLRGDDGNDGLFGGAGNDNLSGGAGNDGLFGDEGNDSLFGGKDDDTLSGDEGDDDLNGDEGNDDLRGNGGNDFMTGGVGDDFLIGGGGDDFIVGGEGNDTLIGNEDNDTLIGSEGNDELIGFAGNNTLIGSEGDDTLIGGEGNDTFVLVDNEKIENFVVGEDVIQLDGLSSGDAIAYDPESGNLLLNGTIVAQLPTELTFESDSFDFSSVDQSELTLDIPFTNDGNNGGGDGGDNDPDNTIAEAIDSGVTPDGNNTAIIQDSIDPAGDVDVIEFQLAAGDSVTLDINANSLGSDLDSFLRLLDESGNELAQSDDNSAPGEEESFDSFIDFTATDAGSYYAQVSSSPFGNDTGDYELAIEVTTSGDGGGNGGNNDFVDLSNITFSRRSDVVEENNLILIPDGSFVSTLAGDDLISSTYTTDTPTASVPTASGDSNEAVAGIYNQQSFDTSSGNDVILGNAEYTGEPSASTFSTYGILNRPNDGSNLAIVSTGRGDDRVLGFAASSNSTNIDGIGNLSSSEINTGAGQDEVRGEATGSATNLIAGISQGSRSDATNLITTGNGDDKVIGKVNNGRSDSFIKGIFLDGKNNQIITGNGNDRVIGEVSGSARFITGIDQEDGSNQIITGKGVDEIVGEASGDVSGGMAGIIQNRGSNQIITGNGNDKVIGKASGNLTVVTFEREDGQPLNPAIAGINQQFGTGSQQISTGNGADEVRGTASGTATASVAGGFVSIIGIAKLNSSIETGNKNDKVIGEASGTGNQIAGIAQQGSNDAIDTGSGNDEVIGTASGTANVAMAGIAQQPGTAGSQIITGEGNDTIEGTASNDIEGLLVTAGIFGDLDILTGSGDDEVIASAQIAGERVDGFAADPFTQGSVTVDTGSGNDLVKGFGQGNFDGGEGDGDIYDLSEYSFDEFSLAIGTGTNNEVNFTLTDDSGERTASTQGFEVFRFADGERSFSGLSGEQPPAENPIVTNPLNPVSGGTEGDDGITGTEGDDSIEGLGGNDAIEGKAGADLIDGGDGADTIVYQFDPNAVTVDLGAGTATDGFGDTDTIIGIENIIGSEFNDNLTGDEGSNNLTGRDGDDTIDGAGGDDFIVGSQGADNLTGGAGSDTFVYSDPNEGGDTIVDFEVGSDKILAVGALFGGNLTAGTVSESAFFEGEAASESAHRFGYDSNSGEVLFDVDGVGGESAVVIATIDTGLNFSNTDITVL